MRSPDMMGMTVETVIDESLCTGCGLCVKVCPLRTIAVRDGKAVIVGDVSLNCGHCAAVCPVAAIQVKSLDEALASFSTFELDRRWLKPGDFDTGELVRLMSSRRACRNFTEKPVERPMLEDLVKIAITAPSGTNSQKWTFTILPTPDAVRSLAVAVARFYEKLNKLAEKWLLRTFLKLVGKPELDDYYRSYYQSAVERLAEWKDTGRDGVLYGAAAVIVVGSEPGASLPKEDAMLATQNILLAAHSMGLGSCLIGMAVEAVNRDRGIKGLLGIPDRETVYAIIALGYPDEKYRGQAGRRKTVMRYAAVGGEPS
jgi:nitroreductase/Pyruvate/2-oxoacid:ferredoxin oxidoreductase delta subunit